MWTPLIFVNLIRVISFTSSWRFTWFVIFLFVSSVICVQCCASSSGWNEEQQECYWKSMMSSHHSMETPLTYTYSESFQGVMWGVMDCVLFKCEYICWWIPFLFIFNFCSEEFTYLVMFVDFQVCDVMMFGDTSFFSFLLSI